IAPIQSLAGGTKAVAAGDFSTRLPPAGHDDLGFLVESFNGMTKQLQNARNQAQKSQVTAERERARLAIILARLSSGVVVVDEQLNLHTVNTAAGSILDFDFKTTTVGTSLTDVAPAESALSQLVSLVSLHFDAKQTEWREQLEINQQDGNKVLIVASTALPTADTSLQRCVVVFDDITHLIQAQKQAAWGEVARRLAHEIKNPLTPIQLSAERLEQRFANLESAESALVSRSTKTIIQQVEAMKDMVNAFSEYARPREMMLTEIDINRLVEEMSELYRHQNSLPIMTVSLDSALPKLTADVGRLRQIIHNLILNAIEACEAVENAEIEVTTSLVEKQEHAELRLSVQDNGPGFKIDTSKVFEPYMTSKPKGTGLGLAIVRKLVEEHGGSVIARNRKQGGAELICHFPCEMSVVLNEGLAA
ncbi:MAG: HAMP domain-containing protein, partial [Gammaproteobacteria bacterium]|nr:HAMP domain-containing protein [Gammaproteobacteria bacterium]